MTRQPCNKKVKTILKKYVSVPIFSCGLAALLLLVSFSFSGSNTTTWNGASCQPGTQYGFPSPFLYSMSRSPGTAPLTHSSLVCISGDNNVNLLRTNLSNAVLDYLFWFAVSLPVVLGLSFLFVRKSAEEEVPVSESVELQHYI